MTYYQELAYEMLEKTYEYGSQRFKRDLKGNLKKFWDCIFENLQVIEIGETCDRDDEKIVYYKIADAAYELIKEDEEKIRATIKRGQNNSFYEWLKRIREKYDIEYDESKEKIVYEKEEDTFVALLKLLHDQNGKTKTELASELECSPRYVQTCLRKICPDLGNDTSSDKQFRIGGQYVKSKITCKTKNGQKEKYYCMEETISPIVLQANIRQLQAIFIALSNNYDGENEYSEFSLFTGADLWCQLSEYAKTKIRDIKTNFSNMGAFIEDIEGVIISGRRLMFRNEMEMSEETNDYVDKVYARIKDETRECEITIKTDGKEQTFVNPKIRASEWDCFFIIEEDNKIEFTGNDIVNFIFRKNISE